MRRLVIQVEDVHRGMLYRVPVEVRNRTTSAIYVLTAPYGEAPGVYETYVPDGRYDLYVAGNLVRWWGGPDGLWVGSEPDLDTGRALRRFAVLTTGTQHALPVTYVAGTLRVKINGVEVVSDENWPDAYQTLRETSSLNGFVLKAPLTINDVCEVWAWVGGAPVGLRRLVAIEEPDGIRVQFTLPYEVKGESLEPMLNGQGCPLASSFPDAIFGFTLGTDNVTVTFATAIPAGSVLEFFAELR